MRGQQLGGHPLRASQPLNLRGRTEESLDTVNTGDRCEYSWRLSRTQPRHVGGEFAAVRTSNPKRKRIQNGAYLPRCAQKFLSGFCVIFAKAGIHVESLSLPRHFNVVDLPESPF
jgi:hypothetical protein